MDLTANRDDRSGPILGRDVSSGCLLGKPRTFPSKLARSR